VTVDYAGVDGRTGKTFESTFKKKHQPATFTLDKTIPGFKKGLEHQRVGDRVLIAMASKDAYGSIPKQQRAQMKQQLKQKGIKFDDTLVFVADIHAASLKHAQGKKVSAKSGLPTFTVSHDKPKIDIPKSDPPKKTTVQPLIKGKGAKVKSGETVTTKSVTALWKNGKIVDNSWKKAWAPGQQQPQQPGQQQQKRLPAMSKAMVGHRVGSRLLIVWPPGTAYKNGDAKQHIGPKDTVVMVVDILFAQPKQ
jgi:peptidylprolyl isomerase